MNRSELLQVDAAKNQNIRNEPPLMLVSSELSAEFTRADFGPDFKWGVATAAYQIEGAHLADDKGRSIWDTFSHQRNAIKNGHTGDTACDFYNTYETDIDLLKSLNMKVFRFSIAWTRILPKGVGEVNLKGIAYYRRIIEKCLACGLEPWVTIYHWDLPQVLQDRGGWTNREVLSWFAEYVTVVVKAFGDKVKHWMVMNEPTAFSVVGYMLGLHAPGVRNKSKFLATVHHAALCQTLGGRIVRENVPKAQVGTTFSCAPVMPWHSDQRDGAAVRRWDALLNRMFIEPALGLGYPVDALPVLAGIEKYILGNDRENLVFDFDFVGLQNYTREVVKARWYIPYMRGLLVPAKKRGVNDTTAMGWEVYPEGIFRILTQFAAYENLPKVFITENGAAFRDKLTDTGVHDDQRIAFYKAYLASVLQAKRAGIDIGGFLCWTFLDNFEWAEGYHPRFGLVYVDFETQQRTVKDSGLWFREFLR